MRFNRRQFFGTLGAAATGLLWDPRFAVADDISFDPNFVVILADTHCGPNCRHQIDFMKKSVADILAFNPRPVHVLIYGDFAFLFGRKEDYVLLRELVAPLDQAGIKWTNCMGNHDRRDMFAEVFPEHAKRSLLSDRLVFKTETPYLDFILLDSLIESDDPNKWITPGEVLDDQRDWLNETLKKQTKACIVGAHHSLDETLVADILKAHRCVAGYINGHHHYWNTPNFEGINSMTLPSNGHWGDIGFVTARLDDKRAEFRLTMKDFLICNRPPEFEPNPERFVNIEKKQGAIWRVDL